MYLAHPSHNGHVERHHGIPPSIPLTRNLSNPPPQAPQQPHTGSGPGTGLIQPPPSQSPPSQSYRMEGRIYSLEVNQQPIRARMCGFGDKDRRPITPPPCVRLVVKDASTGKEVDINEVDTSFYVLTVDLWSADATREVNLVRHSATSPSISAATSSSYPPPPPTPPPHPHGPPHHHQQHPGYPPQLQQQQQQQQHQQHQQQSPQSQYYQSPPSGYYQPAALQPYYANMHAQPSQSQPPQAPSGMFTRNLIGSLSASAFKLTDPDNKIGVWFILQDLSVRTEGSFRLKMNFVNVGDGSILNTGSAPVLASAFSEVFQVYSAKKFPGVIESTPLSKCFATQGIKIPIRRDKADEGL
ncbi:velvet factor-domain-containing protein [Peziza echinospora]|nr:velvet factor-domain-containing protein [Peziza echinospora]